MPLMGAVTIGLLGAGTSLLGGILGSNAAQSAARIQSQNAQQVAGMAEGAAQAGGNLIGQATNQADNSLQNYFNLDYSNLDPYLNAGAVGISDLQRDLSPGGSLTKQFAAPTAAQAAATPGYQFALQQGQQALQRSAAATGQVLGGGTLKSLDQYSQGLASTYYQNAYNNALTSFQTNRNNTLQGLGMLVGAGQNADNQLLSATSTFGGMKNSNIIGSANSRANLGLTAAQIAGSALTGGANARAAGTVGSANAWSNALSGVGNAAMNGYALNQIGNLYSPSAAAPAYDPSVTPNSATGGTAPLFNPPPPVTNIASGYAPPDWIQNPTANLPPPPPASYAGIY